MILLNLSFFVTAAIYASVGFGGGSTYSAILVLMNIDYIFIPLISLMANIIVVSGGAYNFSKKNKSIFKRIAPWIVTSIPASFLGGQIDVPKDIFVFLLAISLFLSAVFMLKKTSAFEICPNKNTKISLRRTYIIAMPIGFVLGFLSGIVGIGGGIFLAPVLYFLKWGQAKEIAGMCSLFILFNSIAGLAGHISKFDNNDFTAHFISYAPVFVSVFVGGQIGAWVGANRLKQEWVALLTAVLIFYVSVQLFMRWWGMVGN